MSGTPQSEMTALLSAAKRGDHEALNRAAEVVYHELREVASRILAQEKPGQTLRTTALVNEAYIRLVGSDGASFEGRSHFLGVAAKAMRSILIDYARARRAQKRGGSWKRAPLDDVIDTIELDNVDLVALGDALAKLETRSPRQGSVVELRYFGGLTIDQAAEVLDVSHATVENDWRFARAWLHRELEGNA